MIYFLISSILFLHLGANAARLGQVCVDNDDCTGENQECIVIGLPCNATQKTCQCRKCFAPDFSGSCQAVTLKRPCDYGSTNCDQSCTIGARDEIFPPNAICDGGLVQCSPPTCFRTENRRCVPIEEKKPFNSSCTASCECSSNMGCSAICQCPAGLVWDPTVTQCVKPVKVDFGGTCSRNADCNVNGANGPDQRSNGYTNSGGRCVSGRCTCADGYFQATVGFYNAEKASFFSKTLCLAEGTDTNVQQGDRCNIDSIGMSDLSNNLVCESSLACVACEGERQANVFGKCRSVIPRQVDCSTVTATNVTRRVRAIGQDCTAQPQCGTDEVCRRLNVDPPCLTGKCACRLCFGEDRNRFCALKRKLKLRDRCWHSDDEEYPPNMTCSPRDMVDCLNDRYRINARNECVLNTYDYVAFGAPCNDQYSNCLPTLQCLASSRRCLCTNSNKYWDSSSETCVQRQIGEACRYDHECDDRSLTQTRPSGRTCMNGVCSCDANFRPVVRDNMMGNALEIIPPTCGAVQSVPQTQVCAFCTSNSQRCSFFNVTNLPVPNDSENRNTREVCFPNAFPTTTTTAPIVAARVVGAVVGARLPTTRTTSRAPTSRAPLPTTVRTTTTTEAEQVGTKVGGLCFSNSDCGANEMCFSPYDPICSGTCLCKPGFDMDANRNCVAKAKLRVGDTCSGYSRPDMFQHTKMFCEFGTVSCGECPCSSSDPMQENQRCSTNCDCDGNMICNQIRKICMCAFPLQRFDTTLKLCVSSTDTTRYRMGQPCRPASGCFRPDLACDSTVTPNECRCANTSFLYNYQDATCYPRNFGDPCSTNADCQGIGRFVGRHGYASRAGAACVSGRCGCAPGYRSTTVALDEVRRLYQLTPQQKTICLQEEFVTSRDYLVPKGGSCSLDPLTASSSNLGLCEPGLLCIQCPKETTGKCRSVRDTARN